MMSNSSDRSPFRQMRMFALVTSMAVMAACSSPQAPGTKAKPETGGTSSQSQQTLFDKSISELRRDLDARTTEGVDVPVPVDAGGGYTHEQHKQNAKTIYEAGMLYQLTGEEKYRELTATILEDYAALYPEIGLHPKRKDGHPAGRLFWQGLNESWWLVYAIQGYDAVRDDLSQAQREAIETNLIRPMADFLSEGSPDTFNRIHNHGTWAAAAVGMTGYAIDDRDYVEKALYGLDKSGDAGFLKQIDELFSPDGYYAEGPYYQRYALMPFVLFAQAIHRNDPDLQIFDYRDGVLRKAITSTIQQTYAGRFFPINDAIREKGLNTAELRYAVAIAYGLTGDDSLLSIAQMQKSIVPTPEGRALSDAISAGKAKPFAFRSLNLRDGANGDRGGLMILRSGREPDSATLVFKAASQGLGHGHFDRLGLVYFDNGDEVIADYGAARFLNVEPKNGGHYLPENTSWAKQTVAHNTLVVDQSSQFGGDWELAETYAPTVLAFDDRDGVGLAAAEIATAYDGVNLKRIVAMVDRDGGGRYVIDVIQGNSDAPHTYDLPVHFKGQLIDTNIPFQHATQSLAPLGTQAGYQHLWKTAQSSALPASASSNLSFLIRDQFYSVTFASNRPLTAFLTRLGANDPNNNLRNEQAMILRTRAPEATFVSVYERYGLYDNDEEVTVYSGSSIKNIEMTSTDDGLHLYKISPKSGGAIHILVSDTPAKDAQHTLTHAGRTMTWTGPVGLQIVKPTDQTKNDKGEE